MNPNKEAEYIAEIVRLKAVIVRENGIKKVNDILQEISNIDGVEIYFADKRVVQNTVLHFAYSETTSRLIPARISASITTTISDTIILE